VNDASATRYTVRIKGGGYLVESNGFIEFCVRCGRAVYAHKLDEHDSCGGYKRYARYIEKVYP
jgi:hypothetical protein